MQGLHLHASLLESHGLDPHEALTWLEEAKCEILPDVILEPVINSHLYSAIAAPMMHRYQRQKQFCIRAWLGCSEEASLTVTSEVTQGTEILNEEQVAPDEVNGLPRKSRFQLYR